MKLCACALVLVVVLPASALAEDRVLPRPDYNADPADPAWLTLAVQMHGHLGPWAAAGVRLGSAARQAAGAEGYFDLDVVVEGPFEKPPKACFLDGVQLGTGATLGKRNLQWRSAEQIAVIVTNRASGRVARVIPTPLLLEWLNAFQPRPHGETDDHDDAHMKLVESLARRVAAAAENDIATVNP